MSLRAPRQSACTARATLLAALLAAVVALAAYLLTLSPSISWAEGVSDSGELAAAAFVLGVPHPTGYPLYMVLAWPLSHLPFGEPARVLNAFSALCGALAVGLTTTLAAAVLLTPRTAASAASMEGAPSPRSRLPAEAPYLAGAALLAGGSFLGADSAFWLQATNVETRTLAALLLAAVLVLLVRGDAPHRRRLVLSAWGLQGFALADHLLCLAVVPSLVLATLTCPLPSPEPGARRGLAPGARLALLAAVALLPGLALYAYLPLRAAAAPPLDWGDPRTPARVLWTVTGAQYRGLMGVAPQDLPAVFAARAGVLGGDMGAFAVVTGLAGLALLCRRRPRAGALLGLAGLAGFLQSSLYGALAASDYLIPCEVVLAAGAGSLLASIVTACLRHAGRTGSARHAWRALALGVALLAMAALAQQVTRQRATTALAESRMARGYGLGTLRGLPRRSLVLSEGDADTFALWYAQFALGVRPDVAVVNADLLAWHWYAATVRARYPWLRWDGAPWPGADADLAPAGRAARMAARETALLRANAADVPIFWTVPDPLGQDFCRIDQQGNLFRCSPLRRGILPAILKAVR